MELSEYLVEQKGLAARVAKRLDVAPAYLWQMANGVRPVPPSLAPAIERICEHRVPLWKLRPRDWHLIWPNLIGTEGAPEVAEQANEEQGA